MTLIDPDLFKVPNFRIGASQMVMQQITLGGAMIAVPLYLQVTLEYNAMQAGLSLAPLSLTMFAVSLLAGKKAGDRRPASIIRVGFGLTLVGMVLIVPIIPRGESGWALLVPLLIAGTGLGLLVSQLNNYILAPIAEERVSEAAGVNSAGQSFGLSFGLAVAGGLLLAALSWTFVNLTESSDVIPPAQQDQIADALEDNAELVSTTQLELFLADEPSDDPRRDRPHQHRSRQHRPPSGHARADPRLPARLPQLVPPHAPARLQIVTSHRRNSRRLTRTAKNKPPTALDAHSSTHHRNLRGWPLVRPSYQRAGCGKCSMRPNLIVLSGPRRRSRRCVLLDRAHGDNGSSSSSRPVRNADTPKTRQIHPTNNLTTHHSSPWRVFHAADADRPLQIGLRHRRSLCVCVCQEAVPIQPIDSRQARLRDDRLCQDPAAASVVSRRRSGAPQIEPHSEGSLGRRAVAGPLRPIQRLGRRWVDRTVGSWCRQRRVEHSCDELGHVKDVLPVEADAVAARTITRAPVVGSEMTPKPVDALTFASTASVRC